MIIISNHTKIDNNVVRNNSVPDYAMRLYLYVAGLKNGFQLNDAYIEKVLNWSHSKVARAKRELVKANLIYVEKTDKTTYFLYIGTSTETAMQVRNSWIKQDGIL